MVNDFMVCVDKIIASAPCYESSSVSEVAQPNSAAAATTGDTNAVLSMKKASGGGDNGGKLIEEEEGKKGYCSKKMKEIVECRICQEEDDFLSLEAPCACSGTLKFAHRKCIQRWCNKKGDITCEICKQDFSPNYSLPPTRSNPDLLAIDIRQAWSPRIDLRDSHLLVLTASQSQLLQSEYEDYVAANSSSLACLRVVALILIIILLLRQVLMLTRDSGMIQESSTLINFQVLVLQFAGFLLPCYVVARTWYLQSQRRRQG
ncbi:E3 ubiquitin-protein ligase MARCHF8-like isoform X1 [Hibiscus syriacus]|uniref:E3 ubiquitin-protein ligase MARCHF8-like isoform X1 n=1 Tax=Hibiscus syriacus TaxID=106335 RepID=UPI0019230CE4|nr:E3 ubiquitin-protein ligase MARCHF8-like isoform X1 [Hibiscus syriacus]